MYIGLPVHASTHNKYKRINITKTQMSDLTIRLESPLNEFLIRLDLSRGTIVLALIESWLKSLTESSNCPE